MERSFARETAVINPLESGRSAATWEIPPAIPHHEPIPDGQAGHRLLAQQVRE